MYKKHSNKWIIRPFILLIPYGKRSMIDYGTCKKRRHRKKHFSLAEIAKFFASLGVKI
jgi:hypothetical protein